MEHEEFSMRIRKKFSILHQPNIFVKHRFPNFFKLFSTIFLRSRSWVRLRLFKKVEFGNGVVYTKFNAFITMLPLIFVGLLITSWIYPTLNMLSALIFLAFLIFNWNLFRFFLKFSSFSKTLVYVGIHFCFTLTVGLGAVFGLLSPWKSKI